MKKVLLILFCTFSVQVSAQEVLDKIIAIVDNEIILKSQLEMEALFFASQRNIDPKDERIKKEILNKIIENKLLYTKAELDSVFVKDEDVEDQLENMMNYYVNQYGSKKRVEEVYGMGMEQIKRKMRDNTRKNMMAERLKGMKFNDVQVTRREVKEFFESYEDSLNVVPEKFAISHIFLNPQDDNRIKRKTKDYAQSILDSIKKGADFAELAKKVSNDPGSASRGGDLGSVKRGVFYPEFESAAFSLAEGELSDIVESPVGFHIIQLLERKGESIHTRHILIKLQPDDEADLKTIEMLSDLRDSIVSKKNTFEYFAQKFSNDKQTAALGGDLGVFEVGQLEKGLRDVVYKLKPGEISFPKRINVDQLTYGYHIVLLRERTPEHIPTLETDYEQLKQLAAYNKKVRKYNQWIAELKEDIFIEIRM